MGGGTHEATISMEFWEHERLNRPDLAKRSTLSGNFYVAGITDWDMIMGYDFMVANAIGALPHRATLVREDDECLTWLSTDFSCGSSQWNAEEEDQIIQAVQAVGAKSRGDRGVQLTEYGMAPQVYARMIQTLGAEAPETDVFASRDAPLLRKWDAATGEWLQAAPGPQTGWTGDVSSLVRTPVPPRIVLHTANVLRATEIRTWGHAAATVRWQPPEDGATQLTVAHFKAGGPVYDDALSRLGDTQGPLLLMLPTRIAAALHQELDGCEGLRVGWEAVADGTLLALLHRDTADGCQWDALTPHLTGRHVYMASPPQGHPRPAWDDFIAAFHDHGILPGDTWQEVQRKTLGKDYRRRVRARLLEIRDPLRQRWDDLWLRHLHPWSPPSHLPHTCRLCGECDTVSSAAATGANRCERCTQVAACPWPEPPAGPRRRTEEEALRRRIEGAHTPSHEQAGPAGAALLWIHVHLRDPTSIAHLSHVFAP